MVSSKAGLVLAVALINGASAAPTVYSNDLAAREPLADSSDSLIYMEKRKGGRGGGGRSGGSRSSGSRSSSSGGLSQALNTGKDILKKGANFASNHKEEIGQIAQIGLSLLGAREEDQLEAREEPLAEALERRRGGGGHGGGHGGGGHSSGGHSSSSGGHSSSSSGHSSGKGGEGHTGGGKGKGSSHGMSKMGEAMKKFGKDLLKNLDLNVTAPAAPSPPAVPAIPSVPRFRIGLAGAPAAPRGLPEDDLEARDLDEDLEMRDLLDIEDLEERGLKSWAKSTYNHGKNAAKKGVNFVKNHKEEIGQAAQVALPLVLALREEELLAARNENDAFELEARADGLELELDAREYGYELDELD